MPYIRATSTGFRMIWFKGANLTYRKEDWILRGDGFGYYKPFGTQHDARRHACSTRP